MKISIVGAGNAGCFTALHYAWWSRNLGVEVELIHNPTISPEPVGQATTLEPARLIYGALGFDWSNNTIHATPKTGVVYEGWGKVNEKVSSPFASDRLTMHFCPSEMQNKILNSGLFKVIEDDVDPKDVDADYIFDCRGKPKNFLEYDELKNPINSAIIGKPNIDVTCLWTRSVATPDGWTFIIPMSKESPSHDGAVGYLYNNDITSREDAEKNFLDLFDVDVMGHLKFDNYVAKSPVVDDRIFLQGNKLFFLEPLEATALQTYLEWARYSYDAILRKKKTIKNISNDIRSYIIQIQNFILWHYQFGSKYDTPFWDYAKSLIIDDPIFDNWVDSIRSIDRGDVVPSFYGGFNTNPSEYGFWGPTSFKLWYDGMTRQSL